MKKRGMSKPLKEDLAGRPLTKREIEVLVLLATGLDNAHIGKRLGICDNTAKNAVWSIKCKTRIESRTLLAFYAFGKGHVTSEQIKVAIARQQRKAKLEERRMRNVTVGVEEKQRKAMTEHSPQSQS